MSKKIETKVSGKGSKYRHTSKKPRTGLRNFLQWNIDKWINVVRSPNLFTRLNWKCFIIEMFCPWSRIPLRMLCAWKTLEKKNQIFGSENGWKIMLCSWLSPVDQYNHVRSSYHSFQSHGWNMWKSKSATDKIITNSTTLEYANIVQINMYGYFCHKCVTFACRLFFSLLSRTCFPHEFQNIYLCNLPFSFSEPMYKREIERKIDIYFTFTDCSEISQTDKSIHTLYACSIKPRWR